MNDKRLIAFLAYTIKNGKSNLDADEKDIIDNLASRWIRKTERVRRREVGEITNGGPIAGSDVAGLPEFAGTITEQLDDNRVRVDLDEPIELTGFNGMTGMATQIDVPIDWVEKEPPAEEAPAQ